MVKWLDRVVRWKEKVARYLTIKLRIRVIHLYAHYPHVETISTKMLGGG